MRLALLIFGVAGLFWSAIALPIFRAASPAREVTERIMADQRFKPGALRAVLAQMERESKRAVIPTSLSRAEALVRLGLAESVIRGSSAETDREIAAAEDKVREALSLNPSDSFLWLMLYSVQIAREGFTPETLDYLEQSYNSGPREGWIILRRNRLALSVFALLAASAQERVVLEFAAIVDADLIENAVTSLTGVGWPQRERLLAALEQIDLESRKSLQRRLLADGIKLSIPGISNDERPWR